MTILVALHDPIYGTVIGSDTQYTSVGNKMCIPGGKWVFANGWAIGVCGEMKFLNIIRENAEAVLLHNVSPLSISYALFEMFGDAGYTFKSTEDDAVDGGFQMVAGSFLLANSEATWEIESNGAVFHGTPGQMQAAGSGTHYALGGFHASEGFDGIVRVRRALKAAMFYEPTCGGDVWMASVQAENKNDAVC
jgi:hypothetical protein